jgi:calcineurin-like phosphoesterase family protein
VGKENLVLHLEDFSFKESDIEFLELIINSLNGKKYLILGNHDNRDFELYEKHFYFVVERGFIYAELEGKFWKIPTAFEKATGLILKTHVGRVLFSHYPIVAEEKFFFHTLGL